MTDLARSGRLAGKNCFVTGAASGLGLAIAQAFAAEGAAVALSDREREQGEAAAATVAGGFFVPLDVTDEAQWIAALERAVARLGRLDVLVNNAGIAVVGTIEKTRLEDWRRCYAVNVEGVFLGCKHGIPHLRKAGGGSIVNMASVSSLIAAPNMVAYGSSKAAVGTLTKSVAIDLARRGDRIRCNSIHPIFVATPMVDHIASHARDPDHATASMASAIPLGELLQPRDVAAMAVYLASDESRFVTGAEMVIDGGYSAA